MRISDWSSDVCSSDLVESMARSIAAEVDAEGGSLDVLVCDKALPQGDPAALPPPPDPSIDEVRWYFFTSGTTADPKGAQHTDRTILAGALGMNACLEVPERDRNPVVFPFPPRTKHPHVGERLA